MRWFYNLKIGRKLMLSFLLIALIAGIVGYVGITRIKVIERSNVSVNKQRNEIQTDLNALITGFERRRVLLKDMVISEDNGQRIKNQQAVAQVDKQEKDYMNKIKKNINGTDMLMAYQELYNALDQYAPVKNEYIQLVLAGRVEEARYITSTGKGVDVANTVYSALDNFKMAMAVEAKQLYIRNNEIVQEAVSIMLSLIIMNVGLALLLGWFISRIITRPLEDMLKAADRLAVGDVKVKVEVQNEDEIGALARSFSAMIENILAQATVAEHLAMGDMSIDVEIRSEQDLLGHQLREVVLNLRLLVDEITKMHESQKAGDIDALITSEKFSGAYREVAEGVNQVVGLHVNNILSILNIMGAYSEGDFAQILPKLPGKQAIANEKMDLLRGNLLAVINDISDSSNYAIKGQLEQRVNASRYQGDYAKIITGLNEVMDAVASPISEINTVLQAMAGGRLDQSMNGSYMGDYSQIQNALNNTIKSLNTVLGEISQIAEEVAIGAGQVAESSQALSQASTEQAASVQEITATMNEVASQTRQNAVNANQASEMANAVKENAVYGNGEMQEMLKAMADINDSSNKISRIIKVIDEIAYQTNILALNAAVEAARAGQHGKGFAVVAEEVRNLAARSANAAKETTTMIEGSIAKVEMGTQIANETALALNKINEGVSSVADLINEIATASNDQATAINQVNVGIGEISEVTQMNTATSQESAASSEELANRAEILKERVGRFTLDKNLSPNNDSYRPSQSIKSRSWIGNGERKKTGKGISINLDESEYK